MLSSATRAEPAVGPTALNRRVLPLGPALSNIAQYCTKAARCRHVLRRWCSGAASRRGSPTPATAFADGRPRPDSEAIPHSCSMASTPSEIATSTPSQRLHSESVPATLVPRLSLIHISEPTRLALI
eukprot:9160993-Alexandrium_andersonii.AAC.1